MDSQYLLSLHLISLFLSLCLTSPCDDFYKNKENNTFKKYIKNNFEGVN
jgi:hypothetical protein